MNTPFSQHECYLTQSNPKISKFDHRWHSRMETTYWIPKEKMSLACFALRNIKETVSLDLLKLIYFSNVHSILSYGIVFWGDSSWANKVFILPKRVIRIITNSRSRESCRDIFNKIRDNNFLWSVYLLFIITNIYLILTRRFIHIKLEPLRIYTYWQLIYQHLVKSIHCWYKSV
jgi:hypothetical protein